MKRILIIALLLAGITAGEADIAVSYPAAKAVSLADADVPPSQAHYLKPGRSVTYAQGKAGYNCPRQHTWFSDVSAYRWNGTALGAQEWNRDRTVTYWPSESGRVSFDGITFHNGTSYPVLVTGWC